MSAPAGDALGRLREREQRGDEQRHGDARRRRRSPSASGASATSASPASTPPTQLERERELEQAPQPAPVARAVDVAEAVLDERLLDREVEQRLEEPGRGDHDREAAEVVEAERRGSRRSSPRSRAAPRGRSRAPSPSGARGGGSASGGQYSGRPLATGPRLRPSRRRARQPRSDRVSPGRRCSRRPLPLLFLHVDYQPGVSVGVGSTTVDARALGPRRARGRRSRRSSTGLATGFAAPRARARRSGSPPALARRLDRRGDALRARRLDGYPVADAPRHGGEVRRVRAARAGGGAARPRRRATLRGSRWPCSSSGARSRPRSALRAVPRRSTSSTRGRPGRRQASFLGLHDFAALSGAALLVGLVGLALGRAAASGSPRRRAAALGVVLAGGRRVAARARARGASRRSSLLVLRVARRCAGVALAVGAVRRRRRSACSRSAAATSPSFLALRRASDAAGASRTRRRRRTRTATLLAYIGWRIWLDHPVARRRLAGLRRAGSVRAVPRRRAPALPGPAAPLAFPLARRAATASRTPTSRRSPTSASSGSLLVVAVFAAALVARRARARRRRRRRRARSALLWLLVASGLWTAQGLVAGIPLDALTWLALGLAAADVRSRAVPDLTGEDRRRPSRGALDVRRPRAARALARGRGARGRRDRALPRARRRLRDQAVPAVLRAVAASTSASTSR